MDRGVEAEPFLGAARLKHCRRFEDLRDVRLVGARIRPDGAADGARDGQPELETRQTSLLRLGRRARHRQTGLGD